MFLNVSLKSKAKWIVFVFAVLLVILLLSIVLMLNVIEKTKNGAKIKGKLDLNFTNYYTEADMTVISNKNINTYNVKEWHKEGVITKLEYLDYMRNTVTITLQNNTCNITNSGNIAKLIVNNIYGNRNIASLSTFGTLYNCTNPNCCCSKHQSFKDDEMVVVISLKEGCPCSCNEIVKQRGEITLELVIKNNIPINYTIYDKNKKENISIVYNMFKKDIDI